MKLSKSAIIGLSTTLIAFAQIPDPVLPSGCGVNIHFTRGHEHDLDMIAAAGFKLVRMDFEWTATEPTQGTYDWSAYDTLTVNLDQRGLRGYYILDYSNPLYEGTDSTKNPITGKMEQHGSAHSPQHPASIAAFGRWAAAAVRHFQGRKIIWEIWNEPNITFGQPKPDVEQYTTLAIATCRAIREAEPRATIVAPATASFSWDFLDRFLKSGILTYLDGVSVHPYRSPKDPPETADADYKRLRELIARYALNPQKKEVPILSGEWGYSTYTKGVSLQAQADFIARQQLSNLYCGVPVSIWYDWKNDGGDPNENEHNFGTVNIDLTPKPAYRSFQTLAGELPGFRIRKKCETQNKEDFVLVLTNKAGATKLAAWTLAAPHEVGLDMQPTSKQNLLFVNGSGERGSVNIRENHFSITLSSTPEYISLDQGQLK
jgi:hypothetical protein